MASSGNFCVMNPLVKGTENVSSGNCKLDMTTNNRGALGNFEIPLTGKWYFECFAQMGSAVEGYVGISDIETDLQSSRGGITDSNMYGFGFSQYTGSNYFAIKVTAGTADNSGRIDTGSTNNAVLGIAINRDDNEIKLYTNNTLRFTLSISATTLYYPFFGVGGANNSSYFMYLNAGQDSSFGGNKTAGGNADGNGFGDFFYSPPTNHLALCSANLPISDDIDPAQTDDDIPTKQFGIGLYTGQSGGGNSVVCGFQPDLIWGKLRSGSQTGILIDSSRGQGLLFSATTDDEQTSNGPFISSYNSDGFTFGSSGSNPNDNGGSYVAWCWRANGGTTASNSEGDITSTVQANTKAGFSIVTYTGNRTSSGVSTVGHGLSSAPDMVITKSRSNSGNWWVQHIGTSTASKMLNLQATSAETDKSGNGTLSRPTATVFGTNHTDGLGTNGETHIAYCWHSVEGYSKFGFFEGNNDDDGAFIYTGFRPRLVFIKNIDATNRWIVHDSARRTFNPMNLPLDWDESYGEYTSASRQIDFLSNGFKCRTSDASINGSNTYVYGAWGDVPFKYNNTF